MILLYAVPTECRGQELVFLKHITQRGETIGSMAGMYDVKEDMLKAINCDMDTFYTGLEVLIPVDKKYLGARTEEDGEAILSDLAGYLSGFNEATRVFDLGDYKRAGEIYASAIRTYGKHFPCDEAYFAMALCDYNRKKWSSAIDGFEHVVGIDGCSDELRDYSRKLMAEAEKQREARRERTANFFGGLLQVAAEVGTAYLAASQSDAGTMGYATTAMPQGKSLGSMSNAEFSAYINNSLSQIANISVMQVQQQWAQEEVQVKSNFATGYRRMNGRDPSAEEVQAAYNAHIQTKVNAFKTAQMASSGMYDRELGKGEGREKKPKTTTTPRTRNGFRCAKLTPTDLAHCNDSGVCQACNGRKVRYVNGELMPCKICYEKGVCPTCQGGRF